MTGLIVAGMHRSGTSLVTRLLSAGGWHPGEVLLSSEREEYFEDAAFVGIHRQWLDACLPAGYGHHDWGLSSAGEPDPALLHDARSTVEAFSAQRQRERERWVAKDPRASLYLPEWASVPSLRFVLVYRSPWDVVDSGMRLGHAEFCSDPGLLRRAWLLYNRRLVDFAQQHRDRCVIVSSESLAADPGGAWSLLASFADLDGRLPDDLVDHAKLVTRDRQHPIAALTRVMHPECADVIEVLDDLADLPRPTGTAPATRAPLLRGGELPAGVGVQVVIPCRNDGAYLDEAVASVAAACSGPTELTIVDDGSDDPQTLRVLDALRAVGYHVVATTGVGLAAARNLGVSLSRTAAVLPLDADNRVLPSLLDEVASIERGEADVVHGAWDEFGMRGGRVDPPEASLATLLPVNAIDACALVARSLLDALGGYDEQLPYMEDWDLWLRAVVAGARFRRLPSVTFRYLVRHGSLATQVWVDAQQRDATFRRILDRHQAVTGVYTSDLVVRLVNTEHALDAQHRQADERAADAARYAESIDADRAALAAALATAQRRVQEAEAVAASAVAERDRIAAELAATRSTPSTRGRRLLGALTRRLARRSP